VNYATKWQDSTKKYEGGINMLVTTMALTQVILSTMMILFFCYDKIRRLLAYHIEENKRTEVLIAHINRRLKPTTPEDWRVRSFEERRTMLLAA
jgi:hypothetical protein